MPEKSVGCCVSEARPSVLEAGGRPVVWVGVRLHTSTVPAILPVSAFLSLWMFVSCLQPGA